MSGWAEDRRCPRDRRVTWGRQAGDQLGDRDRSQGGHVVVPGRRRERLLAALTGAVEAVLLDTACQPPGQGPAAWPK